MTIGTLLTLLAAGIGCILLPIVAFIVVKRKLPSTWKIFFIGALTFFVFQIVLRLPWQIPLAKWGLQHANSGMMFVGLALFSALTAGLFEETGRYLAYKYFVKRPSVNDGIALGLGHGGIESILLVATTIIVNTIIGYLISNQLLTVPPEQSAALAPLISQAIENPWYMNLAGLYERVMALTAHVAMSLLVYIAYVRKSLVYFLYALGLHVVIDAGAGLIGKFSNVYYVELLLTVVAVVSFVWMKRLVKTELAK